MAAVSRRCGTSEPPVTLGLPLPPVEPPADCEECAQRAIERAEAKHVGDLARAIDMTVLIKRHHPQGPA
ncbi:hypothetical protein AB0D49_30950 [Streptomyces sp. NPDC048290]|uniref:hypothetical protein n=1 Tax=Streptomyces sp. NPDC048290 TaxID=3155811 RepID=UPI003447DD67